MAFTKKEKDEMLVQYEKWLGESQAIFMITYSRMNMKEIDAFRAKVRDAGGQAHIIKNTLMEIALRNSGMKNVEMTGTTLMGFALQDVPALAKVFNDAVKAENFNLKGGILDHRMISPDQVKSLADLPPLPVMRARLLGAFQAPAAQLVRTLAEPGRRIAAVIQANQEKAAQPAA